MAILDAKLPAWQASTKAVSPTKAEAKTLEGKAPLVIDGGGLAGQRVLLKDQTSKAQNGLWEVATNEAVGGTGTVGGSGKVGEGSAWVLKRTADADTGEELAAGMLVPIEDGETNQATSWVQRTEGAIEVGTTPLSFEALLAGARGNASGDLEGLYAAPQVAEAVIDNSNVAPEAAIGYSKLNLKAKVASTDLADSAKQLAPQLAAAADRKINFGTVVLSFSSSTISATKTVSHGLGVTPVSIALTQQGTELGVLYARTQNASSSVFEVVGASPFGAINGTATFTWLAIG